MQDTPLTSRLFELVSGNRYAELKELIDAQPSVVSCPANMIPAPPPRKRHAF